MEKVLLGYVRISKNDGSQLLDLQKDALRKAGIKEDYITEKFNASALLCCKKYMISICDTEIVSGHFCHPCVTICDIN